MASSEEIEAARVARVAVRADLRVRDTAIAEALQPALVLLGQREFLNDALIQFHPSEQEPATYVAQSRREAPGVRLRGVDLVGLAVPIAAP